MPTSVEETPQNVLLGPLNSSIHHCSKSFITFLCKPLKEGKFSGKPQALKKVINSFPSTLGSITKPHFK